MASDAETASRETAHTAVALLAILGFVLIAVVLPAVGADAPGRSLLPGNGSSEGLAGDGSGALGEVLSGRAASGAGDAGGETADRSSLVSGLLGSLSGSGTPSGSGRGQTGPGGGSAFGALNPGDRTGVGSQGSPLSESLRSQSSEPHFIVRSSASTYWRTGAYVRYTGSEWTGQGQVATGYWPRDPTVASEDRRTITQRYRLLQPASALPSAWQPVDVDGRIANDVQVTSLYGLRYADGQVAANTTYTVTSSAPPRDPARLREAGTDYPGGISKRYTQLPDSTPDRLVSFTDDLTADAETPYDEAVAIERWLESNKRYSLNASHQGGTVADQFVFEMEAGYCEYFASTMAVMLRTQGIPARYAVGYSTGEPRANGTYLVRAMNAHAWVEMYVPDTGWVRFDPTPGRNRLASEFRAYQRAAENGDARAAARRFLESASRGGDAFRPNTGGSNSDGQSTEDGDGGNDTAWNASDRAGTYNHTESGSPGETFDADGRADVQVSLVTDPVPGQFVDVRVERDGTPLADAAVAFDGRRIGTTDASGLVSGRVPFTGRLDVTVTVFDERDGAPAGSAALLLPTERTGAGLRRVAANGTNTTRSFDVPTGIRVGIEGDPAPGETVTVNATIAGRPVPDATVAVNGSVAGRTNADGRLAVSLPVSEHAAVRVERGEAAGNRTLELADLGVDVSGFALPGLSVTVAVTDGGAPVSGAAVSVGDSTVETGQDGTATVSLPLSTGATVTVETAAGLTERRPVRMRFLTAGLLALVALAVLAGAYLLRQRAVAAGRTLGEQLRVALHWLSGAFVAALVALAVRGETLLAALPEYLRRLRTTLADLARDLAAAVRARQFDVDRIPGPRAVLATLLSSLRRLLAGVRESLPGGEATADAGAASPAAEGATADTPDARERVRRAWREFRTQVPVADYRTKTPGELAREGVAAGFPRTAVRTLRDAIRDVEYGRRDPDAYVDAVEDASRELTASADDGDGSGGGPESATHATDGGAASHASDASAGADSDGGDRT